MNLANINEQYISFMVDVLKTKIYCPLAGGTVEYRDSFKDLEYIVCFAINVA